MYQFSDPSLREKCGIVAISNHNNSIFLSLTGLHALQHRGHEAFGVAWAEGDLISVLNKSGTVSASLKHFDDKKSQNTIGHVRYSTSGSLNFAQPIHAKTNLGDIAVAHNGNLTNANQIRQELMQSGRIFQSDVDTEVFVHLVAQSKKDCFLERIKAALKKIEGAYSLVLLHKKKIFGIRDPLGIRPLVLGKTENSYVLASETCALDIMGAKFVREINPGEIVEIENDQIKSYYPLEKKEKRFCIFEYVYFSRPDSIIEDKDVYSVRKSIGKELAKESPDNADMVVPVLDSGMAAALGYAKESKIPIELAIIRNHYAGRSFIEPSNQKRILKVKLKHNTNKLLLKGKNITLVDDSIVRGNTLKQLVKILKDAKVNKINVKIASPKILNPCYYGVDTPNKEGLIANHLSVAQMEESFGVNSICFLSIEGLYKAVGKQKNGKGFCDACFTGNYPMHIKQ